MGFQLPASGDGSGGGDGSGSGGSGGGSGGGGGGKRSRKSAYPRRILQSSAEAMKDQQLLEDADASEAAAASEEGAIADMDTADDGSDKSSPPPTQPLPQSVKTLTPSVPAGHLSAGLEEGPDLLRSLATLNPQSLIPSLYTAWAGVSGGGFNGGSSSVGGFAAGGDPRRPRGRPKGVAAVPGYGMPPSPPPPPPPHASRGGGVGGVGGGSGFRGSAASGGPRPFDPHAVLQPVRIITRKGVAYNRRPRSFYSAEIKLSVIEFAEQHGASAAERQFNIPLSTVQSWMRHENKARILRAPCDPQQPAPVPAIAPVPPSFPTTTDEQPLNLTARIPLPSSRAFGGSSGGSGGGFLSPLSLLPLSHRPF